MPSEVETSAPLPVEPPPSANGESSAPFTAVSLVPPPAESPAEFSPPIVIPAPSVIRSLRMGIIRRMILGLLFILPIVLTVVVVYQIYRLLNQWVIAPMADFIRVPLVADNPYWKAAESFLTPLISLAVVLMFLYLMGYLFQSRLNRWLDWIMYRIPGISILYRAIRDASSALQGPHGIKTIDKVVLVPFPHAGARATGYLMGESVDEKTGRKLACVYIPIGVFPPSGYTLVYWYDDVTITDWDAASPWKMIISGGLTLPDKVPFRQ